MKDGRKILLAGLSAQLRAALVEQLAGFDLREDPAAGPFDLVICPMGQEPGGCPAVHPGEGRLRLGAILAAAGRALGAPGLHMPPLRVGEWMFHPQTRRLEGAEGEKVELTDREAGMLVYLARAAGPVPRDELLREVWGYQEGLDTHTLETHIHRLRRKTGASAIVTEEGGYRLSRGGGEE